LIAFQLIWILLSFAAVIVAAAAVDNDDDLQTAETHRHNNYHSKHNFQQHQHQQRPVVVYPVYTGKLFVQPISMSLPFQETKTRSDFISCWLFLTAYAVVPVGSKGHGSYNRKHKHHHG